MRSDVILLLTLTLALTTSAAQASDTDLDAAQKALGTTAEMQCVQTGLGDLDVNWLKLDLNHDGRPEYLATVSGSGNGTSGCFGHAGSNIHLMTRSASGGWEKELDFAASGIRSLDRGPDGWDDIEIEGPGFCFPIWRHHNAAYGIWKTCENGELVFAEGLRSGAVPIGRSTSRNAPESAQNEIVSLRDLVGMAFDHNGSEVVVVPEKGMIVYVRPKSSIASAVKPGTVLFRGLPWNIDRSDPVQGVAYVFKKGCSPAPYQVRGKFDDGEFTLRGASPKRSKTSCAVNGTNSSSNNASLRFVGTWGDE